MAGSKNTFDDDQHIIAVGDGPPILVFHGGPGFSHNYLVRWLAYLSRTRTLLYFDQKYSDHPSGLEATNSFDQTIQQARGIIAEVSDGKKLTLIAHSWGALVALTALRSFPQLSLDGLLINPVPSTRIGFDQVRDRLFSRMPTSMLEAIASVDRAELSAEELAAILPYYLSPNSSPDLSDLTFNMASYRQIYGSLGDYDLTSELGRLSQFQLITGADDFIRIDDIKDVVGACASSESISDAGHFPFAEQPDQFQSLFF